MFGGETHSKDIDGWRVSWESLNGHRFWCQQEHPSNSRVAAVVMLNPGSLSGNGENLGRDTTLRVLRKLFEGTSYNPFVINLFSLAAARPSDLFKGWEHRDHPAFNWSVLPLARLSAVLYAYGDYENGREHPSEIERRIREVRSYLQRVPEIFVPRNRSGTPKHPLPVQQHGLTTAFRQAIIKHASATNESCAQTAMAGR